jgi:hypothetical protein
MSLQALQWRKLPVRTLALATGAPTASFILNTIYDMLTGSLYHDGSTRTLGSGSAWQMPVKFVTGSNTEAVYVFPGFQTSVSQSVIFSAKSPGASSTAVPPTILNENAYTGSFLYMASIKNASGAFTQWTSLYPFGSSSYSTGYSPFINTGNIANNHKIVLYESKEALFVYMYHPAYAATVAGLAGAIIDPEQTSSYDTEVDGRIYGVATVGSCTTSGSSAQGGILTSFITSTATAANLFTHSTAVNNSVSYYPRFVVFSPQNQSILTVRAEKFLTSHYTNYTTYSGKLARTPVYCFSLSASTFLGRLRDITVVKNMVGNAVVRDSSNNIVGFSFGANETTANNAMLLNYS